MDVEDDDVDEDVVVDVDETHDRHNVMNNMKTYNFIREYSCLQTNRGVNVTEVY